jgi:signal transduction histidine kinase
MFSEEPWRIVPVEDSEYKKVRVRDEVRIREVMRHVSALTCVALIGPPLSEKTRLLKDVTDGLRLTGMHRPIYLDLWQTKSSDDARFFTSAAQLIHRAMGEAQAEFPRAAPDARAFQNYLLTCARHPQNAGRHLVLLIDHLQALPHDLVHSLLLALRSAIMEQTGDETPQLTAVVTGGVNLSGLASGPTSPFNIARTVLVPALSAEQTRALAVAAFEARHASVTLGALESIVEWVGGDRYLVPRLCAWSAEIAQSHRRPRVTQPVVQRALQRLRLTDKAQAPIREATRIIEEDPDSMLAVLRILDEGSLPRARLRRNITRTGVDRLLLSGAVVLAGGNYSIKNRVYGEALRKHFTPEQVGHFLRIAGRWQEAIDYLSPRLGEAEWPRTRPQLLEALVQMIYTADSLSKASDLLAEGLRLAFGLADVAIYHADTLASRLRLVYPAPAGGASYPETIDWRAVESVETQTYFYSDYALRDTETDVRLVAPLVGRNRTLGIVIVDHYLATRDPHELPADLSDVLRFLGYASAAMESVLVRVAYRKIGRAVLSAGAAATARHEVLEAIGEAGGCVWINLYLIDVSGLRLEMAARLGKLRRNGAPGALYLHQIDHPAARCIAQGQPVFKILDDAPAPVRSHGPEQSALYFPLVAGGSTLGALELGFSTSARGWPEEDLRRTLAGLVDQVAIAVHNTALVQRTDQTLSRRVQELERLSNASLAVSSTLDLDLVLSQITADVQSLFPGTETTVWEYDPTQEQLTVLQSSIRDQRYRSGRLDMDSVTGCAVSTRHMHWVADLQQRTSAPIHDHAVRLGLQSMVATPLLSRNRVLGTINLYSAAAQPIGEQEAGLLAAFAAHAAIAIDNARQYQALEAARRELEESRERELFDLAHALQHRLGNAIGDVPHHLQRVREALRDGRSPESHLAHIERRTQSLSDLLEPVKTLVRLRDIALTRLDLSKVVEAAWRLASPCEGVTFDVDFPIVPVWVEAQEALLKDTLLSVIENACEAGAHHIDLRIVHHDNKALLTVSDNGPGIAPAIQERIFEPGFSTKATPQGGRGQGLFTARAILRKFGGAIDIQSQPGLGATVAITLPSEPLGPRAGAVRREQ